MYAQGKKDSFMNSYKKILKNRDVLIPEFLAMKNIVCRKDSHVSLNAHGFIE